MGGAGGAYAGHYQMGAQALQTAGFLKPGATNVKDPSAWTGAQGIGSLQDYLGNPDAQKVAAEKLALSNLSYLSQHGKISPDTPPDEQRRMVAAAHGLGAAGSLVPGNKDAFGSGASVWGDAQAAEPPQQVHPITVNIPGLGVVGFPAGMTQDQITQAIQGNILPKYAPHLVPPSQEPGIIGASIQGGKTGFQKGIGDWTQTVKAALSGQPGEVPDEQNPKFQKLAAPLDFSLGIPNLPKVAYHIAEGLTESSPSIAAFIGGSALGGGPEEPVGLATGSVAAGLTSALQGFGPYLGQALKANPQDPDAAWNQAAKSALADGAISTASFGLFTAGISKGPIQHLLFQALGVQPAVGAAGVAAQSAIQGKTPTAQELLQGAGEAALGTAVPMAAHVIANPRGALRGRPEPVDRRANPELAAAIDQIVSARTPPEPGTLALPNQAVLEKVFPTSIGNLKGSEIVDWLKSNADTNPLIQHLVSTTQDANHLVTKGADLVTPPPAEMPPATPLTDETPEAVAAREEAEDQEPLPAAAEAPAAPVVPNTIEDLQREANRLDEEAAAAQRQYAQETGLPTAVPLAANRLRQQARNLDAQRVALEKSAQASALQGEPAKEEAKPVDLGAHWAVVNQALNSMRSAGRQGRLVANAATDALKNNQLSAAQVYAAFKAGDVLSRVLPQTADHRIQFVDKILADTSADKQAAAASGAEGQTLGGMRSVSSDGLNGLIKLALDGVSSENAAHESMHVVEDYLHQYDRPSWDVLNRQFRLDDSYAADRVDPNIRRMLQSIRNPRDPMQSAWDALRSSGIGDSPVAGREWLAYAFGQYDAAQDAGIKNFPGILPGTRRFFQSLRNIKTSLGNALRGMGFRTSADVFKSVSRGTGVAAKEGTTPPSPVAGTAQASALTDKERAPAWYSPLERAVVGSKQDKATGEQWLNVISKTPGVKGDEIKWTGIDDFLKEHAKDSLTKADLQQYMAANKVEVNDVTRGRPLQTGNEGLQDTWGNLRADLVQNETDAATLKRLFPEHFPKDMTPAEILKSAQEYTQNPPPDHKPAKYESYTLPGGENYRELLLTTPERPYSRQTLAKRQVIFDKYHDEIEELNRRSLDHSLTRDQRLVALDSSRALQLQRDYEADALGPEQHLYRSPHWEEPNILAHVRFDERKDAQGNPMLFLQEVQSDWHQAGREKGYRQPVQPIDTTGWGAKLSDDHRWFVRDQDGVLMGVRRAEEIPTAEHAVADVARAYEAVYHRETGGVPDAPYKKTEDWAGLAMRRMIRWAAEHDFDKIGWTTGEQQAARYDLSHQVDQLLWSEKSHQLIGRQGTRTVFDTDAPPERLREIVGQDLAKRLMAEESRYEEGANIHVVTDNLKVGGEGMKSFYDKILPSIAEKLGKKFGAKVGETEVRGDKVDHDPDLVPGFAAPGAEAKPFTEKVHTLEITPKMKESALKEGMPQFSALRDISQASVRALIGKHFAPDSHSTIDNMRRVLQDYMLPVMRAQERFEKAGHKVRPEANVYRTEELSHTRKGQSLVEAEKHLFEPLLKHMAENKISPAEFGKALWARHAPERNEEMKRRNTDVGTFQDVNKEPGSGMGTDKANAAMAAIQSGPKAGAYKKAFDLFDKITSDTTRVRIEGGLLPKDAPSKSPWKFYAPLKGWAEEPEGLPGAGPRTGRGGVSGFEDKSPTGRSTEPAEIMANAMMQNEEARVRSEENRVKKSLYELAKDHPDEFDIDTHIQEPTYNRKTGQVEFKPARDLSRADNVVAFKENGKVHYITIFDPQVARAMKNMGSVQAGGFVQALAKVTRFLSAINTSWSPEFLITNASRTAIESPINLTSAGKKGMAAAMLRSFPDAYKGMFRYKVQGKTDTPWAKEAEKMLRGGGGMEYMGIGDLRSQEQRIKDLYSKYDADRSKLQSAKQLMNSVTGFVSNINHAVDGADRLATYVTAKKYGFSEEEALSLAKNSTVNFSRKGEWGSAINAFKMFYNASAQTAHRMFRTLNSPTGRKIAAGMIAMGGMMEYLNQMTAPVGPDGQNAYDALDDRVKDFNIIIPSMFNEPGQGYHPITIPLPIGFRLFSLIGRNVVRGMFFGHEIGNSPTEVAKDTLLNGWESFNPLGGSSTLIGHFLPTVAQPFADIAANRNYFGQPIVPTQSPFGAPKPNSQLAWKDTPEGYKALAQGLNAASGGDSVRPGGIDMSPESIKYIVNFFAGSVGGTIDRFKTLGLRALSDAGALPESLAPKGDLTVNAIPFARRVLGSTNPHLDQITFNTGLVDVTYAERELRQAIQERATPQDLQAIRQESQPKISLFPAFQAADKQIQNLRANEKRIQASKTLSAAQRKSAQDQSDQRISLIMQRMNKRYIDQVVHQE